MASPEYCFVSENCAYPDEMLSILYLIRVYTVSHLDIKNLGVIISLHVFVNRMVYTVLSENFCRNCLFD